MAKSKSNELNKIASKTVTRGLSLFNLTVSGGAKFASLKIGDIFRNADERERSFARFLSEQATVLAEELGKLKGSIMKAGQMLSVYGEHFLPDEVNSVLKTLQSQSRPVVWAEMEKMLHQQLGADRLAQLDIDMVPVAAASMGQVYRAIHRETGREMALKIQYPGVDKAIDSDLRALRSVLAISNLVPITESFDEIFKEIRMMLHYEADYERELQTLEDYRERLRNDPRFVVPAVYPEFSSKRVLAMEFVDGAGVDSAEVLGLDQRRRNMLGCAIMDLMFKEIFEWRTVQTDPHLGNFKIQIAQDAGQPDRIVLLDFGAVRKFPKRYIDPFRGLVRCAVEGDRSRVVEAGRRLGFLRDDDPDHACELFFTICQLAVEGFAEECASPTLDGSDAGSEAYEWAEAQLLKRISRYAKDAVFAFKLRTPPREAVFLDRKMVGTYILMTVLGMKFGPRQLIQSYVAEDTPNTG